GFIWPSRSDVDAALGLVLSGPAAVTAFAGLRAGRAPDRGIAAVVERVVGKVVAVDVAPDVLLAPVDEGVDLPDPALRVPLELRRSGARRRLLATDPRAPGVDVLQRALE